MFKKIATQIITGILILSATQVSAESGDWGAGNGGDECERKIQTIRNDIVNWLQHDGYENLNLEKYEELAHFTYASLMLKELPKAKISCPKKELFLDSLEEDPKFPKTCINSRNERTGETRVQCTYDKFMKLSIEQQYRLIHHEYAGLADIEANALLRDGSLDEESNYGISNQISGFLEEVIIKRLAVNMESNQQQNVYINRAWVDFKQNQKSNSKASKIVLGKILENKILKKALIRQLMVGVVPLVSSELSKAKIRTAVVKMLDEKSGELSLMYSRYDGNDCSTTLFSTKLLFEQSFHSEDFFPDHRGAGPRTLLIEIKLSDLVNRSSKSSDLRITPKSIVFEDTLMSAF